MSSNSSVAVDISSIHTSVLLHESFELLKGESSLHHIDATLGMGGHASFFLSQNPHMKMLGFDQDISARTLASQRLESFQDRITIIPKNFECISDYKEFCPTSILFDVGVSSLQFDEKERGFSFRFDAPLDMRMDQSASITAQKIVNEWSQDQLEHILKTYGEEPFSFRIAKNIVEERVKHPINTTLALASVVERSKPVFHSRKKNAGGHPSALVFQALRIAVNRELEVLEKGIRAGIKMLDGGGRIGVISFHSLEDRIVKQIFDEYAPKKKHQKYPRPGDVKEPPFVQITPKPLIASLKEQQENPRSRSAKLRVLEKTHKE